MDNIIFITGALGIGYLIYKNTENENIGKSEVLEAVPETKPRKKKIEVTKIGLLPAEDKKALMMNLKNAKSYSSTFAIVTAVVGGVFTSFYISKKMIIVLYEIYNIMVVGESYGYPVATVDEILPSGMSTVLNLEKRMRIDRIQSDMYKAAQGVPPREKINFDPPENKKLDEIEENNNNEIKDIRDMPDEDPMLSQGNIPLESFKGGTVFIKPQSEIKIETIVEDESMQTANINKIDNITIGVEKSEESEETELEKLKSEIDKLYQYIDEYFNEQDIIINEIFNGNGVITKYMNYLNTISNQYINEPNGYKNAILEFKNLSRPALDMYNIGEYAGRKSRERQGYDYSSGNYGNPEINVYYEAFVKIYNEINQYIKEIIESIDQDKEEQQRLYAMLAKLEKMRMNISNIFESTIVDYYELYQDSL